MNGGKHMEGDNILSGGIDALKLMKENVLALDSDKEKYQELLLDEKRLEKVIEGKEKDIQEEIAQTIKKRKEEIESSFDKEIDKTKSRMKKIQGQKDKLKDAKISERIKLETAEYIEENKNILQSAKKIFKQNHVPKLCNNKLYYALFSPKDFLDGVILLIVILLTFLVIPCGIYFYLIPEQKIIYLVGIYFITSIVFIFLYIFIYNKTKLKHPEEIAQVKALRIQMKMNRKKVRKIKKRILKDNDESPYGLEQYNENMQDLESKVLESERQKEESIQSFLKGTQLAISTEIQAGYQEEVNKQKADLDNVLKGITEIDNRIKEQNQEMTNQYEAYLGKEIITIENIDKLINLMETRNIVTISEAVNVMKQE